MTYRDSTGTLTVGGVRIDFESASTLHGVRNPIGQLTFTVMTPLPTALTSDRGPIGKRVVLTATQASHDGVVNGVRSNFRQEAGVIFSGTIQVNAAQSDPSGRTRTFRAEGDLRVLAVEQYEERAWDGPLQANTVIRGRLNAKGFGLNRSDPNRQRPPLFLDDLRFPNGSGFTVGGNPFVDDGQIILKDGSSELALIQNLAEVPGYALYETPAGPVRLSRVIGIPPAIGTTELFRADGGYRVISSSDEGFSFRSEEDTDEVYNFVEVFGVTYQEEDGTGIDIRSFPASVALNLDIDEDVKVRHVEFSSPYIYTQDQADGAREIRELDMSIRPRVVTIELDGMPTAYPGHIHKLVAPDLGLNETSFVMTVVHAMDSRGGYRTTLTYRRGAGSARPAGVDLCVFRTLTTGSIHLGDEFVNWYVIPNHQGGEKTYTFTPTADQSSLSFVARAHGCNSQYTLKPLPEDLTGSKVSVEQLKAGGSAANPDDWERVGEGTLPVLDERYPEQRAYSNDANWVDVKLPIPGSWVSGRSVRVRIVAGSDGAGLDDFELKNIRIMSCEDGQPVLPTYPRPPTLAIPPRQEPGTTSPGNQPGGPTDPGGGATQTPRPARFVFKPGGTAKRTPSAVAGASYSTKEAIVAKGQTRTLRITINDMSGLVAGTGSRGSGFSEYVAVQLRGQSASTTLYGKLLNDSNVVQAGSGNRHADFAISGLVTTEARTIVPSGTFIATETATTITHGSWSYIFIG